MEKEKTEAALSLLKRAVEEQQRLNDHVIRRGIVERSVPILWFGEPIKGNWVTIATNPSDREFTDGDQLREGNKARFYYLPTSQTLSEYLDDHDGLEQTIYSYLNYYKRNPYRSWFGRKKGGKLEAFLNGLGGSFYGDHQLNSVVHTDFLPFATKQEYSKLTNREPDKARELIGSTFAKACLHETLHLLEPSLIILLGAQNCERFTQMDHSYHQTVETTSVPDYPAARYQLGRSDAYGAPVLGIHFKPSEQMVGLGKGYGSYQRGDVLRAIGKHINPQLRT